MNGKIVLSFNPALELKANLLVRSAWMNNSAMITPSLQINSDELMQRKGINHNFFSSILYLALIALLENITNIYKSQDTNF